MDDLNSDRWNQFRRIGYKANSATNIIFGIGAYGATVAVQKKYGKWKKLSNVVSTVSILGRCVSAGFICIGVSSWLCSYYCFNRQYLKPVMDNMDNNDVKMSNNHIFALKTSVLLFSISTYSCIALFSNLKIQKIDLPDIDLYITGISPKTFIVTGSLLATIMAIPTTLIAVDWIKDCYSLYYNK